ncbi:MAG: fumarate hydratase [Kineosporiaceae bacterium]|nr:fumarate hydratase [Kineosporiaceae bacterium]
MSTAPAGPEFTYTDLTPLGHLDTPFRLLTTDGVRTVEAAGRTFLEVDAEALRLLSETAMHDIAHYLRPAHLAQLAKILDDPEASANDKFVALDLLRNANVAAGGVLPMCQDTGTAIIMGKRGSQVLTTGVRDEQALSRGVFDAYTRLNLRYSQMAPLSMWEEKNTGTNLPAQIELYAETGEGTENVYKFLFMAKGGGSANKSYLFQETKALLNPDSLMRFLDEKLRGLGTAACPPYHLAIVIGGTSAEYALKTAKYASAKYLDGMPTAGSASGHGFRDVDLEAQVLKLTQDFGIGAQFGGKYFCHDVRVIRLPRHGASLPVAVAVSCSADRQVLGKITPEGVFIEQLETDPAHFLPEVTHDELASSGAASGAPDDVVRVDLNRPMSEILAQLTQYPVKTRLSLTGPLVVARDIAHAKIKERLDAGEPMPAYLRDHPVYYAGPAKTPTGMASGSFGPTTAGRMDSYVDQFQAAGGSMVMLAKGNRSAAVTKACADHGGFYLGSIGGPAARLAQDCIKHVEVVEYAELGMEAVWRIEVEDFPAFIVVDDKGNDFFSEVTKPTLTIARR